MVEFHSRPGCFVCLPPAALQSSDPRPTLRVRTAAGRTVYLTCSGWTASPGQLLMHRHLARCLSLNAGETVSLTVLQPPSCRRAVFRARSEADYELLSLSGPRLQDGLLERAGCLWPGAVMPLWLDSRNVVTVAVAETVPGECCLLVRMTEVEIQPPPVEPEIAGTVMTASAGSELKGRETETAEAGENFVEKIKRTLGLIPPTTTKQPPTDSSIPPPPPWSLRVHSLPPPEGLSPAETFTANRVCFCLTEDAPVTALGWCELTAVSSDTPPPPPAVVLLMALDRPSERYPALWSVVEAGGVTRLAAAGALLVPDVVRRQLRVSVSDQVVLRPLVTDRGKDLRQLTCAAPVRLEQSQVETVRHHLTAWQRCLGDDADIWWRSGALLRLMDERTLRPFDVVLEADSAAMFCVAAPPLAELSATCLSAEYGSGSRPAWPLPVDQLSELALPSSPGPETSFTAYSAEQKRLE